MDAIPAFLFWRPWQKQARWTIHGELEYCGENPSLTLPGLETPIFALSDDDTQAFSASSMSWYCHSNLVPTKEAVALVPDASELLQKRIITPLYKNGILYFKLSDAYKREIMQRQPSTVLIQASCDLAILAVKSLPDPYSEPLWELVSSHCEELFRTTTLPAIVAMRKFEITAIIDIRTM